MGKIFEQQEDGTLKPIEYPAQLVKKVVVYEWLRGKGFIFEEIRYILENPFI